MQEDCAGQKQQRKELTVCLSLVPLGQKELMKDFPHTWESNEICNTDFFIQFFGLDIHIRISERKLEFLNIELPFSQISKVSDIIPVQDVG